MKIQSLSVVVPNKKCINDCQFCVSKMHTDQYKNQMDDNLPFFDLYLKDYLERLEFARHNGCNTVMLTGNSEPQQNRKFLTYFGMFMQMMRDRGWHRPKLSPVPPQPCQDKSDFPLDFLTEFIP